MTNPVVYDRFNRPYNGPPPTPAGDVATVQAAASECDINVIVRRLKEGLDPGVRVHSGSYVDSTKFVDQKTNLDILRRHQSVWESQSDAIKARYKTPAEFYEAQQKALEESARTSNSLDVTGPTDSKPDVSSKKGESLEAQNAASKSGKKGVQKGDGSSSQE